ncbi:MAG: FAD-binding oxidoreductase, partial [Pseudomonadota bacterium]
HLLIDVAKAAFPSLDVKNPKFWMGRRPSFPDSLPMLGGVEGQPGLILNFGHSHYGLMMAPSSGEQVARLICGDFSNLDITALSPSRF